MDRPAVRKTICALVCAALLLCFFSSAITVPARAETWEKYEYEVNNGEVTITKMSFPDFSTTVPAKILGMPVTAVGSWAYADGFALQSATVSAGVKYIGGYAFAHCQYLNSISFPDTVEMVGFAVVWNTKYYNNSANWRNNALYIGDNLVDTANHSVLFNAPPVLPERYVIEEGTRLISYDAFMYCSNVKEIIIPKSVKYIGGYAFSGTGYAEDLSNWEDGQLYIGDCLVQTKNEDVPEVLTVRDGTRLLADYSFNGSTLTKVDLPASVTDIGYGVFGGCADIREITVGNAPEKKGWGVVFADSKDAIDTIRIQQGTTFIGDDAFTGFSSVTALSIPEGVTSIGNGAFADCAGLSEVVIPEGVTSIGSNAFKGCVGLTSVTLPNSLTSVGKDAFNGCSSLKEIKMGGGISNLATVLGTASYNINTVTVLPGTTAIGPNCFRGMSGLEEIVIPESVSSIGENAFANCTKLKEIAIPDSVKTIQNGTFSNCRNLSKVQISEGVEEIGKNAFQNCVSLTDVTIPDSVTLLGGFSGCTGLKTVAIGNGVTDICVDVFNGCTGLTEILLPESVEFIGENAFAGCSNLTAVTISKNTEDIRLSSFNRCDNLTIYCYAGSSAHQFAKENRIPFVLLGAVPGDVDGSGAITSTDARLVLQLSVGKIGEDNIDVPAAADVDGDNSITSTDARLILQKSVGKIDAFPVE